MIERVFLDANILFSAALKPKSDFAKLWQLAGVELWTCGYCVREVERNLPGHCLAGLRELLQKVRQSPDVLTLGAGIVLHDKDRPVLASAIAAQATHLLTGDKAHFRHLFGQVVHGVLILPPGTYLAAKDLG